MNNELVINDVINGRPLLVENIDKSVPDGFCGCYAIYCDKNTLYYIGASVNCKKRMLSHLSQIRRKQHSNSEITRDAKKYGQNAFHFFILEECEEDSLEDIEKKWYGIIGDNRIYNDKRRPTKQQKRSMKRKKHGADTLKYARLLISSGYSNKEVSEKTGLSESYIRVLIFRNKEHVETSVSTISNIEQNPFLNISNSETDEIDAASTAHKYRYKTPFHITALEFAYYATVASACYGFTLAMPGFIGISFAIVYGLLSFAALQMVKDSTIPKTAEYGRNLVYILEIIACVFAHYYTINRALWANLKALPFEVSYLPKGGVWEIDYAGNRVNGYWQNGDTVFNLACILAAILGGLAVAAISLRLELTKETTK